MALAISPDCGKARAAPAPTDSPRTPSTSLRRDRVARGDFPRGRAPRTRGAGLGRVVAVALMAAFVLATSVGAADAPVLACSAWRCWPSAGRRTGRICPFLDGGGRTLSMLRRRGGGSAWARLQTCRRHETERAPPSRHRQSATDHLPPRAADWTHCPFRLPRPPRVLRTPARKPHAAGRRRSRRHRPGAAPSTRPSASRSRWSRPPTADDASAVQDLRPSASGPPPIMVRWSRAASVQPGSPATNVSAIVRCSR